MGKTKDWLLVYHRYGTVMNERFLTKDEAFKEADNIHEWENGYCTHIINKRKKIEYVNHVFSDWTLTEGESNAKKEIC